MDVLWIETKAEARAMNEVLHCGTVRLGDEWDTETAWSDRAIRRLARRVLIRYRRTGEMPNAETRRALAVCCA